MRILISDVTDSARYFPLKPFQVMRKGDLIEWSEGVLTNITAGSTYIGQPVSVLQPFGVRPALVFRIPIDVQYELQQGYGK